MRRIEFTFPTQNRSNTKAVKQLLRTFGLMCLLLLAGWANRAEAQCALVCNDGVNVSLPGTNNNCQVTVTIDMVLEDQASCGNPLQVSIMNLQGQPIPTSPTVNASHIGLTLLYSVTEVPTGNSCWGTLKVEDKLGPNISGCGDIMLPCIANSDPTINGGNAPTPLFSDCSAIQSKNYSDILSTYNCVPGSNLTALIQRTWTAVDVKGNVSTCQQYVSMTRVSLQNFTPVCPPNINLECTSDMPSTHPSVTGYPTINVGGTNWQVIPGADNFCELAASYSDEVFDICGGGLKILRTWNIYDWCLPTNPNTPNPFTCIQVIKIEDKTAPTIVCPAPIVHPTAASGCSASLTLPPANVSDVCSGFTVKVLTPFGIVNGNGGLILNVPVGTHTISYVAEDQCGNIGTCQTTMKIEDKTPPIAICDEHTTVSLSADGTATVAAMVFDDGSTDNCAVDKFHVRRMPSACQPGTAYGDFVTFNCCDVGADVMVAMRVRDFAGNINECMINVKVQDKIAPTIICPPNKTIQCSDAVPPVQAPTVNDNCSATWTSSTVNNVTNCGTGTIVHSYTATDIGGLTASCQQVISVVNSNPFNVNDITWPLDFTTAQCNANLDFTNLPLGYDVPEVAEDACDMVAVTHTDQMLPTNAPACFKILRKWIVIDWCQYNPNVPNSPGYWTHTQILKVEDNTAPVLTCPTNQTVTSLDANCQSQFVQLPAVGVTDCSNSFVFDTRIDYFNNGSTDLVLNGPNASGSYPFGTHKVSVKVEDKCGNFSNCTYNVTVVDAKKPTPICVNGLAVELMDDPVNGGGMIQLTPQMFNQGSFDNCTSPGNLSLNLTPSFFDCDDIGSNVVYMYVTDAAGNTDFCETYVIIQDNMVICPDPQVANVVGGIATTTGAGLNNVTINVSGNGPITAPVTTNAVGHFSFFDLDLGYDYTFTPNHNVAHLNGVTTYDMVLMTRHILNIQPFDSPYKFIAGDVNNNGAVTTADVVELRKLILQVYSDFPNNTSWRFIDADHVFPNPNSPYSPPFNEFFNVNDLNGHVNGVDFVAVKIGDVNGSAVTNLDDGTTDDRNLSEELTFVVDNEKILAGETFRVAFRANNFINLLGYQFAMHFDKGALELVDIETGDLTSLTKTNFGLTMLDEGIITTSWDNSNNTLHDNNTVLFTLIFKANANTSISDALRLAPNQMVAEAYQATGDNGVELLNVGLQFNSSENLGGQFELFQNNPNPFRESTTIGFRLPEAGKATLSVYDMSGKMLTVLSNDFAEGYNEVIIGKDVLGTAGVLFYKLETPGHTATRRMVRM